MSVLYRPRGRAGEYSEWAVNLYGGCSHGCKYCYVPAYRRQDREKFETNIYPYKDILRKLENDCRLYSGDIHSPIMFSFTSDPYQPADVDLRVTREAIGILKRYGFRVCLLTKGGLLATRDFDLLEPGRDVIAATLTFVDPDKSKHWEPGAALPQERFKLLQKAKAAGLTTWASLEPVIDPKETLRIIELTHAYVDLYKVGTFNYRDEAKKINWKGFASAAIELMSLLDCAWYIKHDLRPFLPQDTQVERGVQV